MAWSDEDMSLADLHVHSTFSDGKLSVRELVDWYGSAGVRTLGITDHWCDSVSPLGWFARALGRTLTRDSLQLYLDTLESEARRAKQRYGMTLVTGIEFTWNTLSNHRSAHIVVLSKESSELRGLNPNLGMEQLLNEAKQRELFTIAAHPLSTGRMEAQTYYLWDHRERLADQIDAWECATWDRRFEEVERSGLPIIANSDLHSKRQALAWRSSLEIGSHADVQDVFECIRAQALTPVHYELPGARYDSVAALSSTQSPLKLAPFRGPVDLPEQSLSV